MQKLAKIQFLLNSNSGKFKFSKKNSLTNIKIQLNKSV